MQFGKSLALAVYLLGPHLLFCYIGLMWYAIAHKWKVKPKNVVTVAFAVNYALLGFGLKLPFLAIIFVSFTLMASMWFGFKC